MPLLLMYRFRTPEPFKKRWTTERYLAQLHQIQARHPQYQIERLEEIRYVEPGGYRGGFDPYRDPPPRPAKAPKVKPRWRVVGTAS